MDQCLIWLSICKKVFECQVVAITEKLSCGQSNIPPNHERKASQNANSAIMAIRLATMVATRPTAELAPSDAASKIFILSLKRDDQHFNG